VALGGGADEKVILDIEILPGHLKGLDCAITELLLAKTGGFGRSATWSVLIGTCQEERVAPSADETG